MIFGVVTELACLVSRHDFWCCDRVGLSGVATELGLGQAVLRPSSPSSRDRVCQTPCGDKALCVAIRRGLGRSRQARQSASGARQRAQPPARRATHATCP